jgi:hypothetical protein
MSTATALIGEEYEGDEDEDLGLEKWEGGVLGGDGRVYCVPYRASRVLRIDPASGTTELIGEEYEGGYSPRRDPSGPSGPS